VTSIAGEGDWTTTFEYNDQGRKSRIVKSARKASGGTQGSGVSLDSEDLFVVPPAGGMVKTSYNERDQAVESRVYTSNGELMSRLNRAYDAKGLVTELNARTRRGGARSRRRTGAADGDGSDFLRL